MKTLTEALLSRYSPLRVISCLVFSQTPIKLPLPRLGVMEKRV
jgi:hypothetical protein